MMDSASVGRRRIPSRARDSTFEITDRSPLEASSPGRRRGPSSGRDGCLRGAACSQDPPSYRAALSGKRWRRPAAIDVAQVRSDNEWVSPMRATHRREKGLGKHCPSDNLPMMLAVSSAALPPPAAARSRSAPPAPAAPPPQPPQRRFTAHTQTGSSLEAVGSVFVGGQPTQQRRGRAPARTGFPTSSSQTFSVAAQRLPCGRSASPRSMSSLPAPYCGGDGAPPSPRCRPCARGVTGRRACSPAQRGSEAWHVFQRSEASPQQRRPRRYLSSDAVGRALSGRAPSGSPRRGRQPAGPTLCTGTLDVTRPDTHPEAMDRRRKGRGSPCSTHYNFTRLW
eukprot:TRINITY_DN4357_c0_g4_i1.p1 TRINITY_DN4357_c0_g4~~TRINITY_DN4357_c0_g4_i1.p1  ORF type:complete len:358 (+),score=57.98 TRINITY_DN4357_c0_g4_i1:63-1076(+)